MLRIKNAEKGDETWTLPKPEQVYQEMYRVLALAGQLSICNADRPFWDLAAEEHFFGKQPDREEEKAWMNPAALFMVTAEKEKN